MKLELFYPVKPYKLIQSFGLNPDYYKFLGIIGHNGEDLVASRNQIVRAAHDGLITFTGQDGSGGWGVVIRTEDERDDFQGIKSYWKTIYWHLLPNIPIKAGQKVKVGDVIGYADSTGFSTNDHLHFGLKPIAQGEADWQWENIYQNNGFKGAVNPYNYWNKYYAEDAQRVLAIYQNIIQLLKNFLFKKL